MPRNKPVTTIDVIGQLGQLPENSTGEYVVSKQQETYYIKPPNWDSVESVELLGIRSERDYDAMRELQSDMLAHSKIQKMVNLNRLKKLYKVQGDLRKRAIEVNYFIKECEDKKADALKAMHNEQILQGELVKKIKVTQDSVEQLTKFRKELKQTVKEFEPYEKIIQEVVDKSEVFTSIKDCIDRCDALMLAQISITNLEYIKIAEIEEMRRKMVEITNAAALTVLGLKNELGELERAYNRAYNSNLHWEKVLHSAKQIVLNNEMTKERTLEAIHQIYQILCKRQNMKATLTRGEIERQMDFIKDEIIIIKDVLIKCRQSDELKHERNLNADEKRIPC